MSKPTQVKARVECETCKGQGSFIHPEWIKYEKADKSKTDTYSTPNFERNTQCGKCKGAGYVECWVDITEVVNTRALKNPHKGG